MLLHGISMQAKPIGNNGELSILLLLHLTLTVAYLKNGIILSILLLLHNQLWYPVPNDQHITLSILLLLHTELMKDQMKLSMMPFNSIVITWV